MKTFFKIFGFVFAALCAWAAYVQFNDPDTWLWVCIYLLAGLASVLFALDRFPLIFGWVLSGAFLVGTIISWPKKFEGVVIGQGDIVNIEEGREALGLLILSVIILIFTLRTRHLAKKGLKI